MKLKKIFAFMLILGATTSISAQYTNAAAELLGWRLAVQAWTFKTFTFDEALDKMKAAGINNIEMYTTQEIGGGIEGKTTYLMEKSTRKKVLDLIKSKGMKLVNYGVVDAKTQEEWLQVFDFAKEMGIETIICEADSNQLNFIEPMCEKYQINIALHNHPNPVIFKRTSIYWNPDFTVSQVVNRNKYIGICPDLGHWLRSGLDPMNSLKKCEGRVLAVHIKDLIPGKVGLCGYHDVPWGTGLCNFSGLMHELKRQKYMGTITIEYDYNTPNTFFEVKESVDFFNRLTTWMSKE